MTPKVQKDVLKELKPIEDIKLNGTPNKPVYIKKKKHKESRTVHTQTENSYLQNIRNKMVF